MLEENFAARLTQLRMLKGVSARDMSLSIGQNAGYIHNIESGKALPSMSAFFAICDYLKISPKEFFEVESHDPLRLRALTEQMKRLNEEQLEAVAQVVRAFEKNSR